MPLLDQRHTVRLPLPDMIVRGQAHTLYAPVYLDGGLVAPASGTVSVYDSSNVAKVDAAAATITSSIATYTISSGTLASDAFGDGWRVEWALTLSSGAVLLPRNEASLVRRALYPVVSDVDLTRRVSSLDPSSSNSITSLTNFQDYLDEAWTELNLRLIRLGNRPNLIMEPSALREPHLYLALALIFEDLASRLNEAYEARAAAYREQHERAWRELSPRYDVADSGQADTRRRSAGPVIMLCGGRPSIYGGRS